MEAKLVLIALLLAGMVVLSTQIPRYRGLFREKLPRSHRGKIYYLDDEDIVIRRGSCVALGGYGCEANNGKCCRKGNPYTGEMRKCVNVGGFKEPKYQCKEA